MHGRGELITTMQRVGEKIRRIRQLPGDIAPHWALPNEPVRTVHTDPWIRRLVFGAIGCVVLTIVLFLVYKTALNSSASGLEQLASQGRA